MCRTAERASQCLALPVIAMLILCVISLAVHFLAEDAILFAAAQPGSNLAGESNTMDAEETDHLDDLVLKAGGWAGSAVKWKPADFACGYSSSPCSAQRLFHPPKS